MSKLFINIIIFILYSVIPLYAQDDKENPENYESEILESAAENTEDEIDATSLTEKLQYYLQHSLDINIATEKEKEHATENWKMVLKNLKEVVEGVKQ